ncbi:cation:proton antiporter [bacterium]|nr:cation:proton antiporter [bacterium]
MSKHLTLYVAILLLFGSATYLVLRSGSKLQHDKISPPATEVVQESFPGILKETFSRNFSEPISKLLLQLIVIIILARVIGNLFQRIGQPAVIGEMVAGILLGPSLLGVAIPSVESFLFPQDSMGALRLFSQVGVILFMFLVGTELDVGRIREKVHTAVLVSHASIVIPFFLGTALSWWLYSSLVPDNISFLAFALFMGIAMSITAFPVLARIIQERGLTGTYLGSLAIACAAVDDATAWCFLAFVIAIVRASGIAGSVYTIALTLIFVFVMLFLIRPWLGRFLFFDREQRRLGKGVLTRILIFALAAALITELIGIHALFGAFLAGVAIPSLRNLQSFLKERLETLTSAFLLPLFFAFSGLRTRLDLLSDWQSWLITAGIIGVAVAGKLGGSSLAARWIGMSWRDSLSLGVLMNARGLIELVVLNIGYDMGILSHKVFSMMVLMALITTFMTGPLLSLFAVDGRRLSEKSRFDGV